MKTKKITVLAVCIVLLITGVYLTKNANISHAQSTSPEGYPATVSVQNFSTGGEKVELGIMDATASQDTLTLSLTMSGVDYDDVDGFEAMVCDPYLSIDEHVPARFRSREVVKGNPTQVIYTYTLIGNSYPNLNINMDWTIGPCDPAFDESNVTPEQNPLLTNYNFEFNVPVNES
ncbi:MAG: hypothetical protein WA110_00640 [Anaerolineaceae bacterium]